MIKNPKTKRQTESFDRMCAGCGKRKKKGDLLRLAFTKDGNLLIDKTGKSQGRGAYICKTESCAFAVKKSKRLSRLLKTAVDDTFYDMLIESVSNTD